MLPVNDGRYVDWIARSILPSMQKAALVLGGVYCANKFLHAYRERQKIAQHKKLEEVGQKYLESRDQRIKSLSIPVTHYDAETMQKILNASVSQLKAMLKSGEVTSEDLVNIFSLRCQTIGLELYAITEMDYENAISQARACDEQIRKEREQQQGSVSLFDSKPLLGIPISIKDTFEMKGFACTTGCIQRKDMICQEDGLILRLIRDAGGIPFVRTNVPQLGMSIECMNRLYGRSLNPWDRKRYPGGSSGGEAILLATRSSPLGLGTDFGGSVRTPACINGICAFKPTNGRVPQKGLGISANTTVGQLVIRTTLGPMAKYVDDLAIAMKVLLNEDFVQKQQIQVRGAYTQVQRFDENQYSEKKTFKIGYFKTLKYFEACEAQQRAVTMAMEALKDAGHEMVEIDFPFEKVLYMVYYQILSSDNNAKYSDILGEEDYVQEYAGFKYFMTEASSLTKNAIKMLLRLSKEHRSADILDWCKVNRSAEEYMAINGQLVKLREEVSGYLEALGIDALLSPGLGVPAFEHGSSPRFIICTIYSLIWNVLNYPSGVVPVTTIAENEQKYESVIQDKITRELNEQMQKNTAGLPMGVQITSYPFRDEVCLNIMKEIESKIDFYATTPLPY